MARAFILACLFSGTAFAQPVDVQSDVQRALMQRQQQSDEFLLQLRQSQQRLQVAPGDLNQQQYLDSRHLGERHGMENLGAQQQLSIGQSPATNPSLDRQAADRARQMELQRPFELRLPPPMVRAPVTPRPRDPDPYFPSFTN
jgi:hypothetical protein